MHVLLVALIKVQNHTECCYTGLNHQVLAPWYVFLIFPWMAKNCAPFPFQAFITYVGYWMSDQKLLE
jgi:putative flippase GtrA